MAQSIKLPEAEMAILRAESALQSRSIAGQAEHWLRIGRAVEKSGVFDYGRIRETLEGRRDADTLSAEEQEVFFDEFADAMWETTPEQDAFFTARQRDGLGVGLDENDNLIYAKKKSKSSAG